MTLTAELRAQVRKRANFRCEYCDVSEQDTVGELTIDHYHPQAYGGNDDLDNLIYCCQRCNQYKSDYWPRTSTAPALWNPRRESFETHFVLLADGSLYPKTPIGVFTLQRLRLNRPPLIGHRLRQQSHNEETRLLSQLRDIIFVLQQLQQQQASLLEQQRSLLEEQRTLLTLLINQQVTRDE